MNVTDSQITPKMFTDEYNPKKNSLSFVRFLLATLVLVSHSHPLTGIGSEKTFGHATETWGLMAVYGFFALSGFLITISFDRSSSVWVFLWHRFLRIYPGFIVCAFITAFGFAPLIHYIENSSFDGFLTPHGHSAWNYIQNNAYIRVHQWGVNDLLKKVPHPIAINGSLWTLIYEVNCYFLVAMLGVAGLLGRIRWFTLGLFITSLILLQVALAVPTASAVILPSFIDGWLFRLSLYFMAGMVVAKYGEYIPMSWKLCVFCLFLLYYTLTTGGFYLLSPLFITYIVFYAGCRLPFTSFDKHGDWSYGMYIYAFPIQQTLAALKVYQYGFYTYVATSFILTVMMSALSYHLIEAPALRLKNLRLIPKP